jgi:FkbM family methyltransferase
MGGRLGAEPRESQENRREPHAQRHQECGAARRRVIGHIRRMHPRVRPAHARRRERRRYGDGADSEPLDDDIREQGLPAPGFLKIDVEGMELGVLRGAESTLRTSRPALFLELHGADDADKRRNAKAVVSAMWDLGYRDILHVESGRPVSPSTVERPSHIFACSL